MIVGINGSYRKRGNTAAALRAYVDHLGGGEIVDLPDMVACRNCGLCRRFNSDCVIGDDFSSIRRRVTSADTTAVVFATPVYLDFPSPKLLSFLSRLVRCSEMSGRKHFNRVDAHFVATAHCSGTKAAIGVLFNAAEMIGFNIPPRSSREWIELWRDEKLRGGTVGQEIRAERGGKSTVVMVPGAFDVLHAGHVTLLRHARSMGDFVIAALSSDHVVTTAKGPGRPRNTYSLRSGTLRASGLVDMVIPVRRPDASKQILDYRPSVFLLGGEYRTTDLAEAAAASAAGTRIAFFDKTIKTSTTDILAGRPL